MAVATKVENPAPATVLLAATALAVGVMIHVREGLYHPAAIVVLVNALAACLGAVAVFGLRLPGVARVPAAVLCVAIFAQFAILLLSQPGTRWNAQWTQDGPAVAPLSMPGRLFEPRKLGELRSRLRSIDNATEAGGLSNPQASALHHWRRVIVATFRGTQFQAWLLLLAPVLVVAMCPWRRPARLAMAMLLVAYFLLGLWVIRNSPRPFIDVDVVQRDAAQALLAGSNPYAMDFPDIYGQQTGVYSPGWVRDGRVLTGYPYPPLTLLLTLPGHMAGDHRYSHLAAVALAGAMLAWLGTSWLCRLAAILLLFTPRALMVIELGWTEPVVVLMAAATVFCAVRAPRWLFLPLGLLLASKQYMVLALPLTVLLVPPPWSWRRWLWLMAGSLAVAAAVTLPLALWSWPDFWRSAVVFQLRQPVRDDSLSLLAVWGHAAGSLPRWAAMAVGWLAVVPAMVLAVRRCPRSPAGFATGLGFVLLVFFSFAKQAFCNYYFFVLACLAAAIAAMPAGETALAATLPATGDQREPASPSSGRGITHVPGTV